jgi:hypothetical protein
VSRTETRPGSGHRRRYGKVADRCAGEVPVRTGDAQRAVRDVAFGACDGPGWSGRPAPLPRCRPPGNRCACPKPSPARASPHSPDPGRPPKPTPGPTMAPGPPGTGWAVSWPPAGRTRGQQWAGFMTASGQKPVSLDNTVPHTASHACRVAALTQDTQHRLGALHFAYLLVSRCPITCARRVGRRRGIRVCGSFSDGPHRTGHATYHRTRLSSVQFRELCHVERP